MDVKRLRREGRGYLAALSELEVIGMSGSMGAAGITCSETLGKIEDLSFLEMVMNLHVVIEGMTALLQGANEIGQTAVQNVQAAGEWGDKATASYLLGISALRQAADAFHQADAELIHTKGAVNVATGHLNHYLNALGEGEE